METTTEELKHVTLERIHERLGAKMVPFAGFLMPVQYSGVNDEHLAVRGAVGVFDVSHMGEFMVRGPQALDLIQRVTSNDASKLVPGKIQYTCLPNETGGIVDDLLVYDLTGENGPEYMLVVNASNIDKDYAWINQHNTFEAAVEDVSPRTSLLAVQGPKALDTLKGLFTEDIGAMPFYTWKHAEMKGVGKVLISTTGYTGEHGYEIYMDNGQIEQAWHVVIEAGQPFGIKPCGLGARDTLRLEMGFCLYGNDIDGTTSPLEAGLGWITKFTKDFVHSAELKAQKEAGLKRRLVGFELIDRGIPRHGYPMLDGEGRPVGQVTSGTMSPSTKKAIGMGYLPTDLSKPGTEFFVEIRGKHLKAVVVKPPFVNKGA